MKTLKFVALTPQRPLARETLAEMPSQKIIMTMIKNSTLIFLTLIIYGNECFAQKASLSIWAENIIYQELPTSVKIVVEERKCGDFKVQVDNGTITGNGCDYKITSKNLGRCNVTIYYENNNDTIVLESIALRVKKVPPPYAVIASKQKGQIKYQEIISQKYIMCKLDNFDYDYRYLVKEFNFIIERSGKQIFQEKVSGYKFTDTVLAELTKLREGDKIFVKNIVASGLNIETSEIEDIELIVDK